MIKKLLLPLFLILVHTAVFAGTKTYNVTSGNWNTAANWMPSGVPTAADDVVIPSGKTVTITAYAMAKSVSVSGSLSINNNIGLIVYGDFTVNSGGSFTMGSGNDYATLLVYGNYTNYGITDFWKSDVVIAGNLTSSSTSDLQKQGNVVVGGNITGNFNTTGGTGANQIYAVDPNATVIITTTSIDNNVTPGVFPSTETQTLIDLVNLVIYGGSCSFTINDIANVSACSGSSAVFTVSTTGGSPAYQWQVNDGSGWSDTNNAVYSGVTSATLTISSVTVAMNNYKYRAKITSASCTKNGNYGFLTVNSLPAITTQPVDQLDCEGSIVSFTAAAAGTGLTYTWQRKMPSDVSFTTIPMESNVTYPVAVAGQIRLRNVGSALSLNGTQYQVIVSNGTCGVSSTIVTLSVNEITGITPVSTAVTQCYGTNYSYTVTTSIPSNVVSYQWKKSVISGTWTDVVDGVHLSGSRTATLNVISGTPAESAEYRVYITFKSSGANCNVSSDSRTRKLTFLPQLQAPVITQSQSICYNTAPAALTATAATGGLGTAYSYQWQSSIDNLSWTNIGTNTLTYEPPVLTTSTYYRIIVSDTGTNSCGTAASPSVLVSLQPIPTVLVGTITQPTCALATGSVVLSGLPATGTWILTRGGASVATTTGTGTSTTISGLTVGTYNFTVSNGTCTSSPSVNVDINTSVPNTWDGTVWSAGTPNTNAFSNQALVFNENYPSSTDDLFGCSCTVNSGFNVVIGSGRTMTITNGVTVSGTLTFNNDASLVQKNDADTNTGDITYNRMTTAILSTDYTYWSSPIAGYTLGGVSQNTAFSNMYYSYNSTSDDWEIASAATLMAAGNGYIIGGPKTYSAPSTYQASFTGIPNNGVINASIGAANTSNLLGNPYPSALNADKFLAANSGVLDGTIYFWTHNTAIQLATNITNGTAGSGTYAYTSDDYASYNSTGGVGTGTGLISTGLNVAIPNGNIASGEGFFTTSVAAGNAVFNNSMRVDNFDNTLINSQFFKTSNTKAKSTNAIEKDRIWLNLTNTVGAFKQTLVGYVTDATNDFEGRFDGVSFDGNDFLDFYSVLQDKNLVIQGRALPFDENDEIPLGYRVAVDGTFTINIDQADGLLADQAIFIEDKLTNTIFDLKRGDYTFATTSGVFNDRFVLRYTNNNNNNNNNNKTLGTNKFVSKENQVLVSSKNKQITINSSIETIDKVTIYDLLGRQIYQKTKVDSNELSISNLVSSHQTLVVKTILQNGTTVSDKIIF